MAAPFAALDGAESSDQVCATPSRFAKAPITVAAFVTRPASMSAWVRTRVAVAVPVAFGAKTSGVTASAVAPVRPRIGSSIFRFDRVTFPEFLTLNV